MLEKDSDASGEKPRLTVLGAGVMGVGITALAVGHGVPVTLIDVDQAKRAEAEARIAHELRLARLMGALPDDLPPGPLVIGESSSEAAGSTAVIEAVTEIAEIKEKVIAEVSAVVSPGTVLVSNTSSIPIDELASAAVRPAELVGTHFMNPSYLIRTVEVIRGARTGEAAMDSVRALLTTLRRQPVVVRDAPGFVTSRVLHPMINDAARVVQEGTATAEDVDALMRGCLGHATGPLRTADLIGIDNLVDSLNVLYERTGDSGCRPCDLLLEKVRAGHIGRKSGRGFYEYEG
ncbi:3-hydroxyacyl-CoA dehydrogenase family protein [Streptomyces stelliscabiei]|uniref:3-hydroxyacyl-CoA dehydrogenase family protein n=1 Tax=Streptomyces stelliscabiei TaxID=146820 RepID=UPI0029BCEEE9|nr:3-hydroxyacyl-CoA dehydrogenase family protein [Streptomyces stelliscabiei]MDX2553493.1 3-hydroxyacyl-CoA dehydrogenase family protein [Streptomyces stelliscabiei]MDX2612529.1 3-hydroxyacyl-CoA dehydrogenase family protein [Streptomyces stelliscabiei]MDX2637597.1 3-hydroxyacyl-CoA dehydrogenase family protein [Streptomyces stelliscabiei]MDX2663727.1 3-hydroxyacyl-CoA dehydrogenase family protein [Streptomyces stelliscabiei]MDX2715816.1 3-hydroxyacyl-CoA dehydrogenase family protein [Strepto